MVQLFDLSAKVKRINCYTSSVMLHRRHCRSNMCKKRIFLCNFIVNGRQTILSLTHRPNVHQHRSIQQYTIQSIVITKVNNFLFYFSSNDKTSCMSNGMEPPKNQSMHKLQLFNGNQIHQLKWQYEMKIFNYLYTIRMCIRF